MPVIVGPSGRPGGVSRSPWAPPDPRFPKQVQPGGYGTPFMTEEEAARQQQTRLEQADMANRNASARGDVEQEYYTGPYGAGSGGTLALPNLPPPRSAGGAGSMGVVTSPGYGGGNIPLSRDTYEQQETLKLKADLAEKNRQSALDAFRSATSFGGGTGPAGPSDEDLAQYEAAQYARAKDRIGLTRAAALKQFQNMMAGRGIYGGSNLDAAGAGDILRGGAGDLADVEMDQIGSRISRAREIQDRNFAAQEARRRDALNMLSSVFAQSGSLY